EQTFDDAGARVALGHELADTRQSHGHERKFGRGKKAVQRDQHQHADETDYEHGSDSLSGSYSNCTRTATRYSRRCPETNRRGKVTTGFFPGSFFPKNTIRIFVGGLTHGFRVFRIWFHCYAFSEALGGSQSSRVGTFFQN